MLKKTTDFSTDTIGALPYGWEAFDGVGHLIGESGGVRGFLDPGYHVGSIYRMGGMFTEGAVEVDAVYTPGLALPCPGIGIARSGTAGGYVLFTQPESDGEIQGGIARYVDPNNLNFLSGWHTLTLPAGIEPGDTITVGLEISGHEFTWTITANDVTVMHTWALETSSAEEGFAAIYSHDQFRHPVVNGFRAYDAITGLIDVGVNNANFDWSPATWDNLDIGDYGVPVAAKQTGNSGAYLRFTLNGSTDLQLLFDVAPNYLGRTPVIDFCIDGTTKTARTMGDRTYTDIFRGQTSASRIVELWVHLSEGNDTTEARYSDTTDSLNYGVRICGIRTNPGATIGAYPYKRGKNMVAFGDSLVDGTKAAPDEGNDAMYSYVQTLSAALGANPGLVGFGSQGWTRTGTVPSDFVDSWDKYSLGRPRDFTDIDYVFICHGTNDGLNNVSAETIQAEAEAVIAAMRSNFGQGVEIILATPPGGFYDSAFAAAVASFPGDTRLHHISITDRIDSAAFATFAAPNSWMTTDGIHLTTHGNGIIGGHYASKCLDVLKVDKGSTVQVSVGVS